MMERAVTRLSKLARGSPMPIITTLEGGTPSHRVACQTWPTISPGVRLRLKPCRAVAQKLQLRAQPTCEETQRVLRRSWGISKGIRTVSTRWPSASSIIHLRVPSAEGHSSARRGGRISVVSWSWVLRPRDRSVMASKSRTPCLCIHLKRLRPLKALWPRDVTSASHPFRSRSSRLGRAVPRPPGSGVAARFVKGMEMTAMRGNRIWVGLMSGGPRANPAPDTWA